jgi:hypothetical protein
MIPGLHEAVAASMDGVEAAVGEEAYVVDVEKRTSIFIGTNIDRKYEEALGRKLNPFEICTSLDVHGRKDGKRWIRDFKFGNYSSWWQLYIQAMAVLWLPGREDETEVDAGFSFVEDRSDGPVIINDSKTLYLMDLDQRADQMMTAFVYATELEQDLKTGAATLGSLRVVEGKWCQYCGAYPHCPAKWQLAKSMLELDVVANLDALSPEECGQAWLKLSEVKYNIIKKTEEALKQRMRTEGGFPLADGKMLRVVPVTGRLGFDKDGAIELLQRLGATENEIVALIKRGDSFDSVRKTNR